MRCGHLTYDTWIWLEITSLSSTASVLNECKKIYAKESLNVHNVKILSNFFSNVFSLFMPFYWEWKLALGILSDFPGIRSLSGLNDLNSLNDLSGLNDLNSLISSKNLLSMMIPLTWQKNYLSLSLIVEWTIKNPLSYGLFATLAVGGCGGHGWYFQPNPKVISQMSASYKCTDSVFIT